MTTFTASKTGTAKFRGEDGVVYGMRENDWGIVNDKGEWMGNVKRDTVSVWRTKRTATIIADAWNANPDSAEKVGWVSPIASN